jgi:hypothetical protein
MSLLARFLLLLVLAVPQIVLAQRPPAPAMVEGVQMPAWVERGGATRPLAPGMQLVAGDQLRTGAGARVLVKLAEGSTVKVGENARIGVAELRPEDDGVFRAALRVIEGAFRFTTDKLSKVKRREVSISVGTVIAGVRGTDLWGKSTPGREVVCLIEGRIEVGAAGEAPLALDQPRQFYNRIDGRTQPLGFVDARQLEQWGLETEIAAGRGAVARDGKFTLLLARIEGDDAALRLQSRLAEVGYAVERVSITQASGRIWELRITGLASRADAEALARSLEISAPEISG